jgi:hypothetical protein
VQSRLFLAHSSLFWNLKHVSTRCKNLLAFVIFTPFCFGGVASNPFLRPGSNRPPPQVTPPPPPPKPAPNPTIVNEVEFRGYFLLKGVPHFCIFNKKANLGEWIKLTEKTYEEFEAQAFDLATETLTLAFNGQEFTISLMESSKSPPQQNRAPNGLPKVNLPSGVTSSSPKVMPPKPKSPPKLPEWISQRVSPRSPMSGQTSYGSSFSTTNNSRMSNSRVSSFVPPPVRSSVFPTEVSEAISNQISPTGRMSNPTFASPPALNQNNPASNLNRSFSNGSSALNSPTVTDNISGTNDISSSSPSPIPVSETNEDQDLSDSDEALDLDSLPPPPPPPNILPPSPPPDILPSLDE